MTTTDASPALPTCGHCTCLTVDRERCRQIAHARYLGADAALAAASWVILSDDDARSILDDIDPEVLDRAGVAEPNLSGEWADEETPAMLWREVTGVSVAYATRAEVDALADAWEDGRDEVWHKALQGVALRTLGTVGTAVRVESEVEATVSGLRTMAGLS